MTKHGDQNYPKKHALRTKLVFTPNHHLTHCTVQIFFEETYYPSHSWIKHVHVHIHY